MFAQKVTQYSTLGFSSGFPSLATRPPWAFGGWSTGQIDAPPSGLMKSVGISGLGRLGQDANGDATSSSIDPTTVLLIGLGGWLLWEALSKVRPSDVKRGLAKMGRRTKTKRVRR